MKVSCASKDTIKKVKRPVTEQDKIFTKCRPGKRLVFKTPMKNSHNSLKKGNSVKKKWVKELHRHFLNYTKRCSTALVIRKAKEKISGHHFLPTTVGVVEIE